MSQIRFHCYVCNQELQVSADNAGRKTKCIQCQTVLTIPAAAEDLAEPAPPSRTPAPPSHAPAPPEPTAFRDDEPASRRPREDGRDRDRGRDDDYDRGEDGDRGRRRDFDDYDDRQDDYDDRGPKAKKWKSNWPRVQLGMLLGFIAMCVVGGAFALEHLGVLIATVTSFGRGGMRGAGDALRIMSLIANILMLLGFLCLIAGQVFWIFISNKQTGLTWAIVALAVGGVSLLFYLGFRFLPIVAGSQAPYGPGLYVRVGAGRFPGDFSIGLGAAILPSFALIFIAAHMMMIGFYLRALGQTLRDRTVSGRGMQIVVAAATAAAYHLIWPFIGWAFVSGGGAGIGALIGVWIFYWAGVVTFILLYVATILTLNMGRIITDY